MTRQRRRQRQYLVYRYQYVEMPEPKWDARRYSEEDRQACYDCLPPTVMAEPGIVIVTARHYFEAIHLVKDRYEEART